MERWNGKVALVTGASAGIGAAIAEELVKHGLKVVGLARRIEKVEALKKNLVGAKGELHALKGDVSVSEDVDAAFQWIQNKFGTIHVLVNNAGILRNSSFVDGKFEHFEEVMKVNAMGLFKCTHSALRLMKASNVNDGHIFHINSIAGHLVPAYPGLNVYPASKYAVTAFTETLRQELRGNTKIRVTSISPGAVETEIFAAAADVTGVDIFDSPDLPAEIPFLKSKDIADALIYALSTPARVQIHELMIQPLGG